jgi:nitrogen fixation protein FixH
MKLMAAEHPWTGRTVLIALLVTFGIVFAVNGIFIYFAVTTWPGLSQSDAYEKGLRYNEVIRAAQLQKDLGWRSEVSIARTGEIHVQLVARDGRPADIAHAEVTIERPVGDVTSHTVDLSKDADGLLFAQTSPLSRGVWFATVTARGVGGAVYRMRHLVEIRS